MLIIRCFCIIFLFYSCSKEIDSQDLISLSNSKEIVSFSFLKNDNVQMQIIDRVSEIDNDNGTVVIGISENVTDLNLIPSINLSEGATINPENGIKQNFENPVIYTITAADGSTKVYEVKVVPLSDNNELIAFDFLLQDNPDLDQSYYIEVSSDSNMINLVMPFEVDVAKLKPSIQISKSASVIPENLSIQDFSEPTIYRVTSEDGIVKEYTVSIKTPSLSQKEALFEIYKATLPEFDLGWSLDEDLSNWKYLKMGGNGKVTGIEIRNGSLVITKEIENLIYLTKLSVSGGSVFGIEFFKNAINLEEIILNKTNLSAFPLGILDINKLKVLGLSENDIASLPSQVSKLKKLIKFYLGTNKIENLPPSLGELKQLEVLDVRGNPLIGELPKEICDLQRTGTEVRLDDNIVCAN